MTVTCDYDCNYGYDCNYDYDCGCDYDCDCNYDCDCESGYAPGFIVANTRKFG